ncbi:MAG: transposase [candidate division NC10 bacterium]|nr:transposase [candidate division NC10 bacterium]
MTRPLRLQYPGALYHITARGNERKAIFRSDADREAFLTLLAQTVDRYRLLLHAYVLMGNHYHLLVETPEANLSLALRHLNGVYTGYFNRVHRRSGHLFQGRYKAIVVEKEGYLLELSRYMHLNPIRARRAVRLGRYPWSSYLAYIGRRQAPVWLTRQAVLGYFGRNLSRGQNAYRTFVAEGIRRGVERPWEQVIAQVVLGGPQFVRFVRGKVTRGRDREVPSRRQLEARPTYNEIRREVEAALPELLRLKTGGRSDPGRAVLFYLGRERGGLSLKALAGSLGVEESTVSHAAGRVARLRREDPNWDRVLRNIERRIISNL